MKSCWRLVSAVATKVGLPCNEGEAMAFGDAVTDIELSPHKHLQHVERFQALAAGRDTFPVTVELDPVDYCNHRCGWCVDPQHGRTALPAGVAYRLLDELRALGVQGIVYKGGGEPTLHPDFPAFLEHARKRAFEVGVVTNGSRLGELDEVLAAHASYVRISVDGPNAASHAAVHGVRDFDQVVAGVENLVRCRGSQRHPVIGVSFAMDYAVIGQIDSAVELGDRLGVDYVLFRPPFFEEVGRQSTMTIIQTHAVRQAFEDARQAYRGPMRVLVDHWVSDAEASDLDEAAPPSPRRGGFWTRGANGIEHVTGRCWAAPLLAVVAADQTVYPCCNLRALSQWAIGRIDYAAGVGFRTVWEGARRAEVMAAVRCAACLRHCTHPLSKYNEIVEYLRGPRHHGGFL